MPRLFVGLEVPEDVGFALSLKRGGLVGARWIAPDNYHITLRYIGDVDWQAARDIISVLDRFCGHDRFHLQLDGLGVFGGNTPRALFASVAANPALVALQVAQERALQRIGMPPESRKFTPHVTLARLHQVTARDVAGFISHAPAFTPLSFPVGRFVLYSSRMAQGGGPYVIEEIYDLAA